MENIYIYACVCVHIQCYSTQIGLNFLRSHCKQKYWTVEHLQIPPPKNQIGRTITRYSFSFQALFGIAVQVRIFIWKKHQIDVVLAF
jgi:hypothetical protein